VCPSAKKLTESGVTLYERERERKRERELYLPQHEYNAQLKIQIKWQAARTGISPTIKLATL